MADYPYMVRPHEPAIFVELYLPKKAAFQGVLYDTLTSGFRLEEVKRHFQDPDPEQQRKIRSLLGQGWSTQTFNDDDIRSFRRVFFGYSLYDVDGVFLKTRPQARGSTDDADEAYEIVEETSQVVRMVFKYPCGQGDAALVSQFMANLQDPSGNIVSIEEARPEFLQSLPDEDARRAIALFEDWRGWMTSVGLFVFGYLIFHICDRIVSLVNSDGTHSQEDLSNLLQDEIWVSSFWNVKMNVVDWVVADSSTSTSAGRQGGG